MYIFPVYLNIHKGKIYENRKSKLGKEQILRTAGEWFFYSTLNKSLVIAEGLTWIYVNCKYNVSYVV